MSFFGLGDIKFNKQQNQKFGPLAALEGTDYQYNTFRYPLDVGNYDKGHYMVIYIRTQKTTKYTSNQSADQTIPLAPGSTQNLGPVDTISTRVGGNLVSKINNNNVVARGTNAVIGGINNIFGQATVFNGNSESTQNVLDSSIKKITDKSPFGFLNTTSLTTDAIALYMPDTLLFSHNQIYEGLTPGNEIAGQLAVAAPGLVESFKKGGIKEASIAALKSGAGQVFAKNLGAGQTGQLALLGLTGGKVVNPMLELIYSSPQFRTFQYDFFFYPRSEREAEEVQKLIERLRFHQAPELSLTDSGTLDGLLTPPSEFEIKFYYGGAQNPNIPQVGTCVLESIDLNYAPNGFSAYEVPGENKPSLGKTGMPVAIQMTLQFKETTYLTKEDFRQDLPSLRY